MSMLPSSPPSRSKSQVSPAGSADINLFTGAVDLTRTLHTLAGLPEAPGLRYDFQLLYESNVARDAATDNLDAPTGILGLGGRCRSSGS